MLSEQLARRAERAEALAVLRKLCELKGLAADVGAKRYDDPRLHLGRSSTPIPDMESEAGGLGVRRGLWEEDGLSLVCGRFVTTWGLLESGLVYWRFVGGDVCAS